MKDLFAEQDAQRALRAAPLAERVRPHSLDDFVGQEHLLGPGKPLRVLLTQDRLPSMILWGPPGCGKTTLARLLAASSQAEFHQLHAVSSGVKEVREVLQQAGADRRYQDRKTILFIDEIHRFNKAQQDALLHSVEEGLITLIGATTENPSFEVIAPLLSRCRVYILEPLTADHLRTILQKALAADVILSQRRVEFDDVDRLILLSGGDARMLLNGFETAVNLMMEQAAEPIRVGAAAYDEAFQRKRTRYDQNGEEHYNIISAFIKSVRGSDPDAAVYWLARMLEGGEDPKFIARRLIILASEDIGNADPYGLTLAVSGFTAVDTVGMPEARIILSQCTTYLACSPKSNASYVAISEAMEDVRNKPDLPVPLHLRNAPTALMKDLRYGSDYRYSHDYDGHFVSQQYLPDGLTEALYYRPTAHGREQTFRDRLLALWPSRKR